MVPSRFTAEKGSFPGGELRLVCAATIDRVWNTHVEAVAMGDNSIKRRKGKNRRQEPDQPKHLLITNDGEAYLHIITYKVAQISNKGSS